MKNSETSAKDTQGVNRDARDSMRLVAQIFLISVALKVLLLPSYRSTDFEVHRNWLALTHSLPLADWYFESTSEWTLDYPPFFAYFEWALSQLAAQVDPLITKVDNLNYANDATVYFQRASVMTMDLLLALSSWLLIAEQCGREAASRSDELLLVVFNAGLLLVDHIHFQYNGFLLGFLVLTVLLLSRGRYRLAAAAFSTLVLLKHLFAPLALVFAAYFLRHYCCPIDAEPCTVSTSMWRLLQLAIIAGLFLAVAFLPFLLQENGLEQGQQIVRRLFPFGRGLVHAYWAPNTWALYCAADKILGMVAARVSSLQRYLRYQQVAGRHASTSGLVGDFQFAVLPEITPAISLSLVCFWQLPAVLSIFMRDAKNGDERRTSGTGGATSVVLLIDAIVFASLSMFMFGYHVHEKAILVPLLMQTFVCKISPMRRVLFLLLAAAGIYGLLPLLFTPQELLTKSCLYFSFMAKAFNALLSTDIVQAAKGRTQKQLIQGRRVMIVVIVLLAGVFIIAEVLHPLLLRRQTVDADGNYEVRVFLPFVPLLITSTACALVNTSAWLLSLTILMQR